MSSSNQRLIDQVKETTKARRDVYGDPTPNFQDIADLWNVLLRRRMHDRITPTDVAQMMRMVKEARLIESPDHKDSLLDIMGYADCHESIIDYIKTGTVSSGMAGDS